MHKMLKIGILGISILALSGGAFAIAGPARTPDWLERQEFIRKSAAGLDRTWTEAEVAQYHTTKCIPDDIKAHLTDAKIKEFAEDLPSVLQGYLAELRK